MDGRTYVRTYIHIPGGCRILERGGGGRPRSRALVGMSGGMPPRTWNGISCILSKQNVRFYSLRTKFYLFLSDYLTKGGGRGPLTPPPLNPPLYMYVHMHGIVCMYVHGRTDRWTDGRMDGKKQYLYPPHQPTPHSSGHVQYKKFLSFWEDHFSQADYKQKTSVSVQPERLAMRRVGYTHTRRPSAPYTHPTPTAPKPPPAHLSSVWNFFFNLTCDFRLNHDLSIVIPPPTEEKRIRVPFKGP